MANVKISDFSTTWTSSVTEYNGIKLNIIDTNSSGSSKAIDLQINSSSVFNVRKDGRVIAPTFVGTLIGTASVSTSSISASYAVTASFANRTVTSSITTTASFATTASYALNGATSSWSNNANTASYALNGGNGGTTLITGSTYQITSSWANNAITAAFALNSATSSWMTGIIYTASLLFTSSDYVGVPLNAQISGSGIFGYNLVPSVDGWSDTAFVPTSGSFTLVGSAAGHTPFYYNWFSNSASFYIDPINHLGHAFYTASLANNVFIQMADKEYHNGAYVCNITNSLGAATSRQLILTVIDAPSYTGSHQTTTTPSINQLVQFSVTASGDSLSYQWIKSDSTTHIEIGPVVDGVPSTLNSGAQTAVLTLQATEASGSYDSAEGIYHCRVWNPVGLITSSHMLIYMAAPTIINQPTSLSNTGTTMVVATGSAIQYEWQYGGVPITDQTTDVLDLATIVANGYLTATDFLKKQKFRVRVYNTIGSVYSNEIGFSPFLRSGYTWDGQAVGFSGYHYRGDYTNGDATQLFIIPYGEITYAWYKNGVNIGSTFTEFGKTSPKITLRNIQLSSAGQYVVSASNGFGGCVTPITTLNVIDVDAQHDRTLTDIYLYPDDTYILRENAVYNVSRIPQAWSNGHPAVGYYRIDSGWRCADLSDQPFDPKYIELEVPGPNALNEWPYADSWPTSITTISGNQITGSTQRWHFQLYGSADEPKLLNDNTYSVFPAPWDYHDLDGSNPSGYYTTASCTFNEIHTVLVHKLVTASITTVTPFSSSIGGDVAVNVSQFITSSISASTGNSVTFNVEATGSNLLYQWYKDGIKLDTYRDDTYSIPSVLSTDSGSYTVYVGNVSTVTYKFITSSVCHLYVSASV